MESGRYSGHARGYSGPPNAVYEPNPTGAFRAEFAKAVPTHHATGSHGSKGSTGPRGSEKRSVASANGHAAKTHIGTSRGEVRSQISVAKSLADGTLSV